MSSDLVLVYGSRGWIGGQFITLLRDAGIAFIAGKSRVDEKQSLEDEISEINPTHVISFIGRTHGKIGIVEYPTIDYLEQPGKFYENVRDNLFSPLVLAHLCSQRNIHFTYLGTGCIFTYDEEHMYGDEGSGFTEESLPNFVGSGYSCVKGFTDRLMSLYGKTTLNLRIRMPISYEQNTRNFITKITTYDKICSIPNSMSVLPDLLPLVSDMMKKRTTGTINLTNPGLITHNEILEMFTEIVAPSFKWENFNIEEGIYILIKNNENIEKIIGIMPINSDSIYSINETFKIEDFTNKTTHFIHETLIIQKKPIKPIIVCDEQGGILCFHKDYNKSGFINRIIKKENLNKSFILDNYDIDYSSFYYVAKSDGVNDTYRDLTDENKVMKFIINLY